MGVKLLLFTASVMLLVGICLFRALFLFKTLPQPEACHTTHKHIPMKLDDAMINRFKGALNIPTISYEMGRYDADALVRIHQYIEQNYPNIHRASFVKKELVANYTLLYTIEGSDKSLKPYLLTSHLDVVPAVRDKWSSDPFEAVVKEDNFIYARGTIDAKHLLFAMLEAFEAMLSRGFTPRRSFYFVFGHDEEVSGTEGANAISKLLPERLTKQGWNDLEYILDEGTIISKTRIPGISSDVALVGVAEKGYIAVKLSTVGQVGHGSMPPSLTAISKLSTAVGKFHSHLMPSYFGHGTEREMIEVFAAYSSWPYKLVYANLWLFKPILEHIFSSDPSLNSLIRTSTAVTMISGGTKENVLPDSAYAIINHRTHPLQTTEDILAIDREIINDPTISVATTGHYSEPTPIAPYGESSYAYQLVKQSILQVYPGTIVVPATFLAATDSRWYTNLTKSIYKFSAIAVPLDEMNRFHGHDERISIENYGKLVNFYHHLIENSDHAKLDLKPKQRDEL